MKTVAIVQARMGSTRLAGKTMMEVVGKPAIWHLMHRLAWAKRLDTVVLATTQAAVDDPLAAYAAQQGWALFRGSQDDVLDRYFRAACAHGTGPGDVIVRVTGDDILTDPRIVDLVVDLLIAHQPLAAHASNDRSAGFPYGAGVEAFTFDALQTAWQEAWLPAQREHVTPFIRKNPDRFPFVEIRSNLDFSHLRFSIDYIEDLEFNRQIFERLFKQDDRPFGLADIIGCIARYHLKHPRSGE